MFFTARKIEARLRELAPLRYRDPRRVDAWTILPSAGTEAVGERPPAGEGRPFTIGEEWGGDDAWAWLSAPVSVPADWTGRPVLLRLQFGDGGRSGVEGLVHLDGHPYQGLDQNHDEIFLPHGAPGRDFAVQIRIWAGLERGRRSARTRMTRAELSWLDETVDDLYFTARAMLETASALGEASPVASLIWSALERAFLVLDWSDPAGAAFYASASRARDILAGELAKIPPLKEPVTISVVGHTHIDVAWLWRLAHTREKAARSFATVLRLMERFPEYIFLQSQPQLYGYILGDYPDLFDELKARVGEGRWEADGAMWLEADTNLPSGESLVRQILFGTRFFEQQFGTRTTVLWLPDVFGYSWALPQILRRSGIETFCTTKISWNQFNRLPHDTFWWRGIDGSTILAHFLTTPEPADWNRADRWFATYNGRITPGTVLGSWRNYRDKEVNRDLLIAYGFGDGGGGVTREMLEMRRRLDRMPGLPSVKPERVDRYFERLHDTVAASDQYVHTWDGELYLEFHRGTYTSQAQQKRGNRKLELSLRDAEWANVTAALVAGEPAREGQEALNQAWEILLRNQFHDIIPGSSIHSVYADSRKEYRDAFGITATVAERAGAALGAGAGLTVLNSAAWPRSGIVRLPLESPRGFSAPGGISLETQVVGDERWVAVPEVPPMGWLTLSAETDAGAGGPSPFAIRDGRLTTPFYELEWDSAGQWTRLYDRRARREVLVPGERGNVFQVFEDKPMNFDAWDIDIFYQQKREDVSDCVEVRVVSDGPLAAVLRFRWRFRKSMITQDLTLYRDHGRIDCVTRVDWHERQKLLKVAFPVDVRATEATYDIQFGNVRRPTHWNTSWDWARFEVVGHQWADLSEHGYGVSLANDCKYGYDIRGNIMRLSLIKSAIDPDPEADQGEHRFIYALIPHQGGWADGGTVPSAWDLNAPLFTAPVRAQRPRFSLIRVDGEGIQVDAVKWAEDADAVILRIHEYRGGRTEFAITSDLAIQSWQETDLRERPLGTLQGGPLQGELAPYEIRTYRIEFAAR